MSQQLMDSKHFPYNLIFERDVQVVMICRLDGWSNRFRENMDGSYEIIRLDQHSLEVNLRPRYRLLLSSFCVRQKLETYVGKGALET